MRVNATFETLLLLFLDTFFFCVVFLFTAIHALRLELTSIIAKSRDTILKWRMSAK